MKTSLRIDGVMVLTGLVAVGLGAAYLNRGKLLNAINPTHSDNLVNKTAEAVVGQENLAGFFDKVYALGDLVSPFNESDAYARQVWGLEP